MSFSRAFNFTRRRGERTWRTMLLEATLVSGDGISSLDLLVLYAVIDETEYLAINDIILNIFFR